MQQNMVAEWTDKYLDYKALKRAINDINEKSLTLAQSLIHIRGIFNFYKDSLICNHILIPFQRDYKRNCFGF